MFPVFQKEIQFINGKKRMGEIYTPCCGLWMQLRMTARAGKRRRWLPIPDFSPCAPLLSLENLLPLFLVLQSPEWEEFERSGKGCFVMEVRQTTLVPLTVDARAGGRKCMTHSFPPSAMMNILPWEQPCAFQVFSVFEHDSSYRKFFLIILNIFSPQRKAEGSTSELNEKPRLWPSNTLWRLTHVSLALV